jgi:hypothetical protein
MSTLQNIYTNKEDIPEGLESYYTESDTGFSLGGVDGLVGKERLDEFRGNNIQLRKDLEERDDLVAGYENQLQEMVDSVKKMESKYSGIDLEEWGAYQSERQSLADKELIDSGEVNTLIQQRLNEAAEANAKEVFKQKEGYEAQLEALQKEITGYDGQMSRMLVDNSLTKIAADKGVRSSAIEDVLSRGRTVFRVEDGKAVAFDENGRIKYGEDAVTPLTIDGWVEGLATSAPHLFEMSTGSGIQQPTHSPAPAAEPQSAEQMILAGLGNL